MREVLIAALIIGTTAACPNLIAAPRYRGALRNAMLTGHSTSTGAAGLNQVANRCPSVEAICRAVKSRIRYARDTHPTDEWRSPAETWRLRKGDCEDYALLVEHLCRQKGFKSTLYRLYPHGTGRTGHVILLIEGPTGVKHMSSNGSCELVFSLDDARRILANRNGWSLSSMVTRRSQPVR